MAYKVEGLTADQKTRLNVGALLPVMEEFYTIQGEGFHSGTSAYFIRIGGCDVGCHWCDVKESWDANLHPLVAVNEILLRVKSTPAKNVVVTGGEPLIYNLTYLTQLLKQEGLSTFIETSGAYPLSGYWDWICLSPKKTMPPLPEIYSLADELKIIVYNQNDFSWAEEQAERTKKGCYFYLQPEWSKRDKLMANIVEYVKTHPKWMVSLQTHKYMNIP